MHVEVAVPCHNEERTIAKVVRDFTAALSDCAIVVYDNASTDATAAVARAAGATVVYVNRLGKGHVVQAIFERSTADVVVLVDGDDTYDAADVGRLIAPIASGEADMVIGTRLHASGETFRRHHHLGNRALTWLLNTMFRTRYADILSGYRAFSRRFCDVVPVNSTGFEIETELMIQAMNEGLTVHDVPVGFRERPAGSVSKLRTLRDGYRIVVTMVSLLRDHRPMFTFTLLGLGALALGSAIWSVAVFSPGMPGARAWRSIGAILVQFSAGLVLVGLILNTINTRMRELSSLMRRKKR